MRLNSRVEVVHFERQPDDFKVQVAVADHRIPGVRDPGLAWFFDVSKTDWNEMDDRERALYLERAAITLLERYGDAREVRIREDGQIVPRYGEAEI